MMCVMATDKNAHRWRYRGTTRWSACRKRPFTHRGASVKASLLFLQGFTEKEKAKFEKEQSAARKEVEAEYADEIAAETIRLNAALDAAKEAKDSSARREAQSELREYLKRMEDTKTRESRALLKERFDYPIFLYEAMKVGISATGEPDANEIYPKERIPAGMSDEETCLELYRQFRTDPEAFALKQPPEPPPSQDNL
jgi:type I restriction enzyme M protein